MISSNADGSRHQRIFLDDQEALTIRGNIDVLHIGNVAFRKQDLGLSMRECGLRFDRNHHHRITSAIKQLAPARRPERCRSAIGRDLPFSFVYVGERPHINFLSPVSSER